MSFQTRKTFGTQIKIFLMKSASFLTLHRQQGSYHGQGTETAWGWVIFIFGWTISSTALADSWLHLVKDSSDSFINIHQLVIVLSDSLKESIVRELVQNACFSSKFTRTIQIINCFSFGCKITSTTWRSYMIYLAMKHRLWKARDIETLVE